MRLETIPEGQDKDHQAAMQKMRDVLRTNRHTGPAVNNVVSRLVDSCLDDSTCPVVYKRIGRALLRLVGNDAALGMATQSSLVHELTCDALYADARQTSVAQAIALLPP